MRSKHTELIVHSFCNQCRIRAIPTQILPHHTKMQDSFELSSDPSHSLHNYQILSRCRMLPNTPPSNTNPNLRSVSNTSVCITSSLIAYQWLESSSGPWPGYPTNQLFSSGYENVFPPGNGCNRTSDGSPLLGSPTLPTIVVLDAPSDAQHIQSTFSHIKWTWPVF